MVEKLKQENCLNQPKFVQSSSEHNSTLFSEGNEFCLYFLPNNFHNPYKAPLTLTHNPFLDYESIKVI